MAFLTGKCGGQPGVHDFHGQILADHPGTQSHHIGVIVQPGHFGRPGVAQQGAANPFHLVGGDGYANARCTQDNAPVALSMVCRLQAA